MKIKSLIKTFLFKKIAYFLAKKSNKIVLKRKNVGLVMLLSNQYFEFGLCSLYLLFSNLNFRLPIFIVSDGTLTPSQISYLKIFMQAEVTSFEQLLLKSKNQLKNFSNIKNYLLNQKSAVTKGKLAGLIFSPFSKTILLDSDVLFFSFPKQISEWIDKDNSGSMYLVHNYKEFSKECGSIGRERVLRLLIKQVVSSSLNPSFNSGLLCLGEKINLSLLDKILFFINVSRSNELFSSEEIALAGAVCSSHSAKKLSKRYVAAISYGDYLRGIQHVPICIHYTGELKSVFKRDFLRIFFKKILKNTALIRS